MQSSGLKNRFTLTNHFSGLLKAAAVKGTSLRLTIRYEEYELITALRGLDRISLKGIYLSAMEELSPDMSGNFFDKIDRINKIFLYSLYPEHPVYPV